ncbi:hypothetical protein SNEBB_007649 [Seison nebaliae]|nr:hypothetical protein SNEBB_007649 [Seison nebaliae]
MSDLPQEKQDNAKDCFNVFDKRYEGKVDCLYIGDMLRSLGINVSNEQAEKRGQTKKEGEKSIKFEEFIPIYAEFYKMPDSTFGTSDDFLEGLKLFDKEGNGYMNLCEMTQVLVAMAEKLKLDEVEELLKATDTREDAEGNFNYESFVKKLIAGPFPSDL